ncbi:MAG: hypothetical protein AB7F99_01995 [Vicinamibacterales bacterium]
MSISTPRLLRITLATALAIHVGAPAQAQVIPSESLSIAEGRLTIGGNVSATFSCAWGSTADPGACADDTSFFNYTDYEHSALRSLVIDLTAALHATDHLSILGDLRSENVGEPQPYALYVRIRPWRSRGLAIQAGRIPPTFGAFARRSYPSDNLLIGYPLAYQYLTSLRPDSLPSTADDLLGQQGRGWLSQFPVGNTEPGRGLPLVNAFRWDTGIQANAVSTRWDAAVALTAGTQANPRVRDDNDGKQLAARIAFKPTAGVLLGTSFARGAFVSRDAAAAAGTTDIGRYRQTAWGADVEYSRDYFLVRAETIVSRWRVPVMRAPFVDNPLQAIAISVEGRYRISPGLYAAARADHLTFSRILGTARSDHWDAPVTRIEAGAGYSLQRNVVLKASLQHNTRHGLRRSRLLLGAAQLVVWF